MKPLTAIIGSLLICFVQLVHAQDNPLLDYLPEKTKMVVTFNPVRLAQKVPGETFRQSFIYREMMKDPSSPANQFFTDISKTGVSVSQDLLLVISEGASPEIKRTHLLGLLQDREKFESMIRVVAPDAEIKTYGTDRIITGGGTLLAWNNRVFVIANAKYPDDNSYPFTDTVTTYVDDTTTTTISVPEFDSTAYSKWLEETIEKAEKNSRELGFELLTPRNGNPLSLNAKFRSHLSEPGDVHIWNADNAGPMGNNIFPMQNLFSQLASLVSGTRTAVLSFENGKIIMRNINYPNDEMAAIMTKHPPVAAGEELLKSIPKGNLLALVNSTYSPAFANELFKTGPFRELTDSLKKMVSFDITKIPAAFGNQMMLAVVQNDESSSKLGIEVILAIPIADFVQFKKMGEELINLYDSLRKTDSTSKFFQEFKPVIRHTENLMVFSLSEKAATGFMDGSLTQQAPAWTKEYTKYPMFMHIDLHQIMQMAFTKGGSKELDTDEQWMLDQFNQVIVYGGSFENGASRTTTEFRFKDQNENSLQQVFQMINRFGEALTKKREVYMDEEYMDSTVVMVDTAIVENMEYRPELNIPDFSDPALQKFAQDYAKLVIEYKENMDDKVKTASLSKKIQGMAEQAENMGKNIKNQEDRLKWRTWTSEMLSGMIEEVKDEEVPIPPPPPGNPSGVEMKRVKNS